MFAPNMHTNHTLCYSAETLGGAKDVEADELDIDSKAKHRLQSPQDC